MQTRRVTLDAMLEYFNNQAQPLADDVKITDYEVTTADGATLLARWYRRPASDTGAAMLYLHGGGMIVGSVPIFDDPVSRYVARTGVPISPGHKGFLRLRHVAHVRFWARLRTKKRSDKEIDAGHVGDIASGAS